MQQNNQLQLSLNRTVRIKNPNNEARASRELDQIAGFLKNGNHAWIAHDAILEIVSAETGNGIAYYNFSKHHGSRGCVVITCVEEVDYAPGANILVIALEFINGNNTGTGMISLFCVQGSKILGSMDFCERITTCRYIHKSACRRSILTHFHGTVAIGTDLGKVFLIDMMLPSNARDIATSPSYEMELFPCINTLANVELSQMALQHRNIADSRHSTSKSYFSIQLEVLNDSGAVLSILCMPNLFTMAIGLNDGRMVLYDLADLQPFHLAYPPNSRAPLTHMTFIEPTDDPRCAVYVWALHSSSDGAIAVMHSLMFGSKINGTYEDFKTCGVRLTMPMFLKDTFPVCCRTITKILAQDDEDVLTLNLIAWTAPQRKKSHVMIFDLNQWYKEEMPNLGDWRSALKYAAVFELDNCTSLDAIINESSLYPFSSILRPEEHFYPNSLAFELCLLESEKFSCYRWEGIQNLVLQQFNRVGPQMALEPDQYFNELLKVAITPQFYDTIFNVSTPNNLKREFLLSVALEYNFTGFLKRCACAWADGSYLGRDASKGIGLSTLTDWIWSRVCAIKDVCNSLCQPLFDFSEQRIDYGTQKMLSQCCKQLKILSELLQSILKDYRRYIPDNIYPQLHTQSENIKMASDYQEVLQWLLNVGLLPEGQKEEQLDSASMDEFLIVPYPYREIRKFYVTQRMKLDDAWLHGTTRDYISGSKYLFIDTFIDRECNSVKLREIWRESGNDGLYPPSSIQMLLRTLLVQDISVENKFVIFVYLFMDITNVLSDGIYSSIVRNLIKFPAVFKMNSAVIKRTQAFWNLDNGHLDIAVEELISPLSHDQYLPHWQRELLIGSLLRQKSSSLALRALRCPGNPIDTELEIMTLMANNLMSEALKVQRASGDEALLIKFFEKILHSSFYEQLLDLSLSDDEGRILRDYLQTADLSNCVNLHFVYLLQRAKFIDAVHLVEDCADETINMEPSKEVLSAFHSTMEPTTRNLTFMTYTEKEKYQAKAQESPFPLSINLIRARCNAGNNIYQKTIQSITEAAHECTQESKELPFIGSPKLGIFEYQQQTTKHQDLSQTLEINEHGKRKLHQKESDIFRLEDLEAPNQKRRKLNDSGIVKRKSYKETRISILTNFREMKPNWSFAVRTPRGSNTPDVDSIFGTNVLNTPVISKKTPPRKIQENLPPTPHSILKTRSCRGSVSPTPSLFNEFNDDNKSVKSITFAAMPTSQNTSFNESSILEEPTETEMVSSAEVFFSPSKSPKASDVKVIASSTIFLDGPKPRPPIKSRSTTPNEAPKEQQIEILKPGQEILISTTQQKEVSKAKPELLSASVSSESSQEYDKPFREKSIIQEDSNDDSSSQFDTDHSEASILKFVRKSVLPKDYDDDTDTSDEEQTTLEPPLKRSVLGSDTDDSEDSNDDEDLVDEHFEEEQLPEHSDYDDDSSAESDKYDYGELNLDDSSENLTSTKKKPSQLARNQQKISNNDEVICLDSDTDSEENPMPPVPKKQELSTLPSFHTLESNQPSALGKEKIDDVEILIEHEPVTEMRPAETQEEIMSMLYENLDDDEDKQQAETSDVEDDIASPPYEEIKQSDNQHLEAISASEEVVMCDSKDNNNVVHSSEQIEMPHNVEVKIEIATSTAEPNVELEIMETEEVIPMEAEPNQIAAEKLPEPETNREQNVHSTSMMSEDCSFVSAFGDQLNEAALISSIESSKNSIQPTTDEEQTYSGGLDNARIFADVTVAASEQTTEESSANDMNQARIMEDTDQDPEKETKVRSEKLSIVQSDYVATATETTNILDQCQIAEDSAQDTIECDETFKQDESKFSIVTPEITNILDIAQIADRKTPAVDDSSRNDDGSLDLTTPKARITRARSESIESSRQLRAKSIPNSRPSSPHSTRSRRSSTEDRQAPKNILKEKLLERIEENEATPVSSPQRMTRRRSQLQETPTTPTKTTRRNSHLDEDKSDSVKKSGSRRASLDMSLTPRRMTRAASKEALSIVSESEKSPETTEPIRPPSRRSERKQTSFSDDDDDTKSEISTRSTRSSSKKKIEAMNLSLGKVTPEAVSPTDEISVSSRRLTRSQLAVLEKSRQLTEKMAIAKALRTTKSELVQSDVGASSGSDNESFVSETSSRASSRLKRKRRLQQKNTNDDDSSSIASKASRKSNSPKKLYNLTVIPEESQSEIPESETSKTRKARTKK